MTNEEYPVIGLMSGTSMDGIDIAFCIFSFEGEVWSYSIRVAETIPYTAEWKERLSSLSQASAFEYAATDTDYGHLLGKITKEFIRRHSLRPKFIASHGHTIFHQPERKITSQIGKGSAIAAETGLPVVCDFRSLDVALGGQGAPLVPIGDRLLFRQSSCCLNLGGFANISYDDSGQRIAFDICPANIVLNNLVSALNKDFDDNGDIARTGKIHPSLLEELNTLEYYRRTPPKSLGKEWVLSAVYPVLDRYDIPLEEKLRTYTEHIAVQIARVMTPEISVSMLVSGGGALNGFLMQKIREKTGANVICNDPLIINFKEALIFAFLGVLRWREDVNCLNSYTGASRNNIGGAIYVFKP
jgi:anhydro-N-acetylmuramic acid kinase